MPKSKSKSPTRPQIRNEQTSAVDKRTGEEAASLAGWTLRRFDILASARARKPSDFIRTSDRLRWRTVLVLAGTALTQKTKGKRKGGKRGSKRIGRG